MGFFNRFKLDRFKKDKRAQIAPKLASRERTDLANLNLSVQKNKEGTDLANLSVHYRVLLRPLISEKAAVAESHGVYTFMVARHANKQQIKQAIAAIYKVKPKKVRVINKEGKVVRHGRSTGRRSDWKKAIVTLPPGQSISIHEGV